MGTLNYGGWLVEFEDRLLAHVQVVLVQRLRNKESFAMSWLEALAAGNGRSSVWLHPEGLYYFRFAGSRVPAINPDWPKTLTDSAKSSQGLILTTEDGKLARSLGLKHSNTPDRHLTSPETRPSPGARPLPRRPRAPTERW